MSSTNTSSTSTMSAPAKKAVKKSTPATSVPEVAAPVVPAAAPAPAPAASKKATPKPSPAASAPVAAPVVAAPSTEPVAAPSTTEGSDVSLNDELKTLQDQLTAIRDSATAALASLKRVAKRAAADIKSAGKKRKNRSTESADGAAPKHNNLMDPVAISDELSAFLGLGKNSTAARQDVTRAMNKYAKENGLTEGQKIKPNAALKKLLRIDDGVELTIFNLQTYLKPHFPPSKAAAAKAAKTA